MRTERLLKRVLCIVAGVMLLFIAETVASTQDTNFLDSTDIVIKSGEKQPLMIAQESGTTESPEQQKEKESEAKEVAPYVPPSGHEMMEITPEEKERKLFEEEVFNQPVTMDFKDADLQNVIRTVATQTGINIIMAKGQVKGTVTLHLDEVMLGAAFDSILKTHDLSYVVEPGNIIRIVPRKEVRPEPVELKTIHKPLNWVQAQQLEETLQPFRSRQYGRIKADPVSNSLIIIDTPEKIVEVEKLVDLLDVPEKQVMIETRMVDMTEAAGRSLGIRWGIFREDTDGVSPGMYSQITGEPREAMVRSEGEISYRPVYDNTGQVVQIPDPYNPGTLTALMEPYIDSWEEVTRDIRTDELSVLLQQWTGTGALMNLGEVLHIFGSDYNLELSLDALEQQNLVTVLANPRVITLNNVPAEIEIKTRIPYLEAVQGPSGEFITNEVEFEDAGTKITVTPNITNNGYVRMKVEPEQKISRGRYQGVPVIDERTAETNVIVKDESTVVIGGLRQHDSSKTSDAIPWVSRIPIFGWLFKSRIYADDKLELVMFVTPHILKEPKLTEKEQNYYDKIDASWKLPDYFFDEVPTKAIEDESESSEE